MDHRIGFLKKGEGAAVRLAQSLVLGLLCAALGGSLELKGQVGSPAKAPPAGAAAGAAKGTAAAVDGSQYVIGPEDTLQITVWREPTLSGPVPVRPDGMISMGLVGDVKAAGLTPMQLNASISEKLKKYVQDPNVSVVVTGVNSQRVYIIGEVLHVGPVNLVAGMSPLQALSAAGGLTQYANSRHIYILRGPPGKQQRIPFNYKQALKGTSQRDISLQPGDTIVVP